MSKYSDGTVKIGVESLYSVQSITRRDILSLIQGPGAPKKYILSKRISREIISIGSIANTAVQ